MLQPQIRPHRLYQKRTLRSQVLLADYQGKWYLAYHVRGPSRDSNQNFEIDWNLLSRIRTKGGRCRWIDGEL